MISSKPYSTEHIRTCLNKAIVNVCQSIDGYSNASGSTFSRNRILTATTVMNILIQFQNKGIKSELCDFMGSDPVPTDSAFCQQRQKLDPEALRAVLLNMNQLLSRNMKALNGYRLLACDGSDINFFYFTHLFILTDRSLYQSYYNQQQYTVSEHMQKVLPGSTFHNHEQILSAISSSIPSGK